MSARTLAAALLAARRAILQTAKAAGPALERQIASRQAEAAVWVEERAEGADLHIIGDELDPREIRRLVAEVLPISDQGNGE